MPELEKLLTVSQLTGAIQQTLETQYDAIWVRGEISNLTKHGSGHWYFSLKDRAAQIGAVMFRRENQRVNFETVHGMEVTAHGRISVYPPHGKYQLIIDQLLPAGQGDLHLAFEALKAKLQNEGAFDPGLKQALPEYPESIGIITSPTGAAIQDMLNILARRFPMAHVKLFPVRVQGDGAAAEIVRGIQVMNERADCDVLITGRGGGSLEDLWAFNEESVARAILASHIPIISAVGHETDTTIADFVADKRAPTPSAAAELVVPDQQSLLDRLLVLERSVQSQLQKRLDRLGSYLSALENSYALKRPQIMLEAYAQHVDSIASKLSHRLKAHLADRTNQLELRMERLNAHDPLKILSRGYSVIQTGDGKVTKSIRGINAGDILQVRMHDGSARTRVEEILPKEK